METIRILAIGNSFSRNTMTYLHQIAEADGVDVEAYNLYIGGCPLERHVDNIKTGAEAYELDVNGIANTRMISIREGLELQEWDYVTLQQKSGYSGKEDTYYPYLVELSAYVKQIAPHAKQLIHQTWAYDLNSPCIEFAYYDYSQENMYQKLCECYRKAAHELHTQMIPVGDVIQKMRALPVFDLSKNGMPLTQDGYHLTQGYGCYAASATWYAFLTGADIRNTTFVSETDHDPAIIAEIHEIIHNTLHS